MKKPSGKKKKVKPILSMKKLGKRDKRTVRKAVGNPKYRDRLFDALAATLEADRAGYFDSFLSSWEQPAAALRAATDALLASPAAKVADDQLETFSMAWDPILVRLFLRLADHLTEEEERVFRPRVDRLAVAWRSFADVLAMRRPERKYALSRLSDVTGQLGAYVADIFLGERLPQLDDGYNALMKDYYALVATLKEGGRGQ